MKYSAPLSMVIILSCACSIASGFGGLVQTFNDPTVNAPTTFSNDNFGDSVAIDGNYALIGASGDKTNGSGAGQAHLFDTSTGNLLQTFNNPTVTSFDRFGASVAIDGNHVLIGEFGDDTNGTNVGQAHLFDAITGNLLRTFDDPTVTSRDSFGVSVAIDGNHVLIGAHDDETNGTNVGQAHLFDAITGNLLHTFDDPTITRSDLFGYSVAVDGNHVLIGAIGDETNVQGAGQAHLFDAITGNLLHTFDDPTANSLDAFGASVAIDGNHVLIGAFRDDTNGSGVGQAHLFDVITGNLLHTFDDPTITTRDMFGMSVAIDGNYVLIGASADDTNGSDVGQAHLFDVITGNLLHTFDDPTLTDVDHFGGSVALDGNRVLIGAFGDDSSGGNVGQAHMFDITPVPTGPTEGNDILEGTDLNDTINALGGDDEVNGLDGNDLLYGGPGADILEGGEDNDVIFAGIPLAGDYVADGSVNGGDFLLWQTNFGSQTELAADGDDSGQIDTADVIFWQARFGDVPTDGAGTTGDVLRGGRGNDLLIGNAGDNELQSDLGDDILLGHAGDDTIFFGIGQDRVVGHEGQDTLVMNRFDPLVDKIVGFEDGPSGDILDIPILQFSILTDSIEDFVIPFSEDGESVSFFLRPTGEAGAGYFEAFVLEGYFPASGFVEFRVGNSVHSLEVMFSGSLATQQAQIAVPEPATGYLILGMSFFAGLFRRR